MTNRSREQRDLDGVDRIVAALPLNDEHKELVREFLEGTPLDEANANEARVFADQWFQILKGLPEITQELNDYVSKSLGSARLSHNLVFPEAILHRLADDPAAAISHIAARDEEISAKNTRRGAKPREGRHDWWSLRIGDCMEDNNDASPSDVKDYLLEIDGVSFRNGFFRYDGPETHRDEKIQPMSINSLRSKRRAALNRIKKFGCVS
jgi:hypothetical protein